MASPRRRTWLGRLTLFAIITVAVCAALYLATQKDVGVPVDSYKGVAVFDNGPLLFKSHGRHHTPTGYYWGQKWQCVEFVKRFYDQAKQHQMPDVWGHAKDFFDPTIPPGAINPKRGLFQFHNGQNTAPAPDDLLVFSGGYGHVAIITEVGADHIEVVQQNIYKKPRQRHTLTRTNDLYTIAGSR